MARLSTGFGSLIIALAVAGTQMGCKTTSDAAGSGSKTKSNASRSRTVEISGESAKKFIDALVQAGVRDETGLIGAMNLQVKSIVCSTPVIPNPTAECELTLGRGTVTASAAASTVLNDILIENGGQLDDGRVGAVVAVADNVECSQPVIPNPQGTCSFTVGGSPSPTPGGREVSIEGATANRFMDALAASGVKDESGLYGATNLAVDSVECSTPVIPNPKANCELTMGQRTFSATAAASKTMNAILEENGATLNDGRVGATVNVATQVLCSKPVVPNPQATCTFRVGN